MMKSFVFFICIIFPVSGCNSTSSREDRVPSPADNSGSGPRKETRENRVPSAYNPIWKAIDEGNMGQVRSLVSKGRHLTAVSAEHNNATVLHWAVYRNKIKMVQLFIEEGLPVDIKDGGGATPFHWAVWHQNKEMAKYLVSKGADVNAIPDTGDSVLVYAIRIEDYPMAEFLIQKGIDINRADRSKNFTPLHEACRSQNPNRDLIKILLTRKADTNRRDSYKCIPRAHLRGEYPDIQRLFDKYEKPPCRSYSCRMDDMTCRSYSLF